ncbi:MAG: hypothetical protein FWG75_06175 [Cystobacterineae bacterium]|nr:hypothetical protein [Cystobacterineae bacterium]
MSYLGVLLWLLGASSSPGVKEPPAKKIEISAKQLQVLGNENKSVYRENAHVRSEDMELHCDKLFVFYTSERTIVRIEAHGHVEANDNQNRAKGEQAFFNNETGLLEVVGKPEAQFIGGSVRGTKVFLDTRKKEAIVETPQTLLSESHGAKEAAQGGAKESSSVAEVEIVAEQLKIERNSQTAAWEGQVQLRRGPMLIRSPSLRAFYDEKGQLQKAIATGGVEVQDELRWAKSQTAHLDNRRGIIVLTGEPEVKEGNSHLRGSRISFVSGKHTFTVENAKTVFELSSP